MKNKHGEQISAPSIKQITISVMNAVRKSQLSRSYLCGRMNTGKLQSVKVGKCRLVVVASVRKCSVKPNLNSFDAGCAWSVA